MSEQLAPLQDHGPGERCSKCGGTVRLTCGVCGWGGTWLELVRDGVLKCAHCDHEQPALCPCPEGPQ